MSDVELIYNDAKLIIYTFGREINLIKTGAKCRQIDFKEFVRTIDTLPDVEPEKKSEIILKCAKEIKLESKI